MLPSEHHPERGRFVRDQVDALRRLADIEVELYEFPPSPSALIRAARELHRRFAAERFEVVHAHFGLSAWPALAVKARGRALTVHGTDIAHPRTRLLTRAVLPSVGLLAAVSQELIEKLPGARARERAIVLPCGVDMERFHPIPRERARSELELDPQQRYVLFPANPTRPEKHHDRARELAQAMGVELLALGGVAPERVPLFINASDAVLVPSEREGFGLAVLEALACNVPVLATPVGVHPLALQELPGTLCAPFELDSWRNALAQVLAETDPRVDGRARAERFSAARMAERVADAWCSLVGAPG
jgi:teichuronic acid biosynthesis glycosyltransferase TuaC